MKLHWLSPIVVLILVCGCTSSDLPETENQQQAVDESEPDAPASAAPTPVPEDRPYPITIELNDSQQAKAQHLLTHSQTLDAKCKELLGDVAPVKKDGDGKVTEHGCPRSEKAFDRWSAN